MRNLLLFSIFTLLIFNVFAQNEYDALRYSGGGIVGSARVQGVAGAFSAVGADMGAATLNPAGMGLYQYSDFSITGKYSIINNNANYLGKTSNGSTQAFTVPSVGYAYHQNTAEENEDRKLKGLTFAFGYNQLDNFKRTVNASGYNSHSSIADFFVERANGQNFSDVEQANSYEGYALYTYAIDTIHGSTTQYFPAFNNGRLQQDIAMTQAGNRGEWFFNLATNHQNKLYLGATLGLQSLRYEQHLMVKETDINSLHQIYQNNPNVGALQFPITSLTFKEGFTTSGSGVNLQAGAIYRPTDAFRFGLSVKTPTYYNLTDKYSFSIETNQQRATQEIIKKQNETPFASQWKLQNPFQATLGLMYLFGKRGFLSADIDYKDYAVSKLSSRSPVSSDNYYSYNIENENIRTYFKQALNYRLGGEARLGNFRLRGGFAMMGSGLKSTMNQYQDTEDPSKLVAFKPNRYLYTLGAGYRSQAFFIDLALVNQTSKDIYHPYTLTQSASFTPTVLNTTTTTSIVISTGASF